jgi:amino acid transporter
MAFVGGWTVFLPGHWDVPTFLFSYAMLGMSHFGLIVLANNYSIALGVAPVLFLFWKIIRGTTVRLVFLRTYLAG